MVILYVVYVSSVSKVNNPFILTFLKFSVIVTCERIFPGFRKGKCFFSERFNLAILSTSHSQQGGSGLWIFVVLFRDITCSYLVSVMPLSYGIQDRTRNNDPHNLIAYGPRGTQDKSRRKKNHSNKSCYSYLELVRRLCLLASVPELYLLAVNWPFRRLNTILTRIHAIRDYIPAPGLYVKQASLQKQ